MKARGSRMLAAVAALVLPLPLALAACGDRESPRPLQSPSATATPPVRTATQSPAPSQAQPADTPTATATATATAAVASATPAATPDDAPPPPENVQVTVVCWPGEDCGQFTDFIVEGTYDWPGGDPANGVHGDAMVCARWLPVPAIAVRFTSVSSTCEYASGGRNAYRFFEDYGFVAMCFQLDVLIGNTWIASSPLACVQVDRPGFTDYSAWMATAGCSRWGDEDGVTVVSVQYAGPVNGQVVSTSEFYHGEPLGPSVSYSIAPRPDSASIIASPASDALVSLRDTNGEVLSVLVVPRGTCLDWWP